MGRCNHGDRSEQAECLELARIYRPSRPGEINVSIQVAKINDLMERTRPEHRGDLLRAAVQLCDLIHRAFAGALDQIKSQEPTDRRD